MPFLLGVLLRLLTRGVPIWFITQFVRAKDKNALEPVEPVAGGEDSQVQYVAFSRLRPCFGFFTNFGTQGWGALQRVTDAEVSVETTAGYGHVSEGFLGCREDYRCVRRKSRLFRGLHSRPKRWV